MNDRRLGKRLVLWLPALAYMAFIFYMSSMSEPPLPANVSDKVAHTFGYSALGFLILRAVAGRTGRPPRPWQIVAAVAIATFYGATDEYHQSFVAGRDSDIQDVYADAIGNAIGAGVWFACGIIWPRFTDV
jgi:VanZ family protein